MIGGAAAAAVSFGIYIEGFISQINLNVVNVHTQCVCARGYIWSIASWERDAQWLI